MADSTIHALTDGTTPASTDEFPVARSPYTSGYDRKLTWTEILAGANANDGVSNVKDFGAKGDGTTNDTSAIQSAYTARAAAGGGIVYFPPGTYKITSTIAVTDSSIHLIGAGAGGYSGAAGRPVLAWASKLLWAGGGTSTAKMVSAHHVQDFCIDQILLDGGTTATYGLYADEITYSSIGPTKLSVINIQTNGDSGQGYSGSIDGVCVYIAGTSTSISAHNSIGDLYLQGATGLVYDKDPAGPHDVTLTRAGSIHIVYGSSVGNAEGMSLKGSDGNFFQHVWTFRKIGTGVCVHFYPDAYDNQIGWLDAQGGGVTCDTPTDTTYINSIGTYARGDTAPVPSLATDARLSYCDESSNSLESGLHLSSHVYSHNITSVYSTSITPSKTAEMSLIPVTDGVAFTIKAPVISPTANETTSLVIQIANNSGGAMGAISWDTPYVFTGGTWTNPANGKRRMIVFRWNGSQWIEISRTGSDY